jgi:hypothetical protein
MAYLAVVAAASVGELGFVYVGDVVVAACVVGSTIVARVDVGWRPAASVRGLRVATSGCYY